MGLLDTIKAMAGELAGDAGRAGRVTAAQTRTVSLQGEVRKAERELGRVTYELIERGEVGHRELAPAATALYEARQALEETENEIAALRGQTGGQVRTVAVTVAGVAPAAAAESLVAEPAAADAEPPEALAAAEPPAEDAVAGPAAAEPAATEALAEDEPDAQEPGEPAAGGCEDQPQSPDDVPAAPAPAGAGADAAAPRGGAPDAGTPA